MVLPIRKVLKKTPLYSIYKSYQNLRKNSEIKKYQVKKFEGYYCVGCDRYWSKFKALPAKWFNILAKSGWPFTMDDAETLNYNNYSCYGCGMTDRDRLYALYFSQRLNEGNPVSILEFAPTKALSDFIKSYPSVKHRTSDLFMEGVDDKLDLQDLHIYKDESFDIFICSHILEHVDDDIKAMRELFRITKKGGWGIAMVPILKGVDKTHEDPGIKDETLRMKYFGQADHVRLYAKKDFIQRLENVGFRVKLLGSSHFGKEVLKKNGITEGSVLYIIHKDSLPIQ